MTEFEQFRYTLEHRILPQSYYNSKSDMLNSILDKEGKFFSDVYLVYSPTTEIVYKEENFTITQKRVMNDNKMLYFVIVNMPEPTAPTLCKRVYFCYEVESGIAKYYTSELTADGKLMMCSWNKHNEHSNYGVSPMDEELEFRKIGNIFLKYILAN